ncbi:biotin synthase auxiliary protein BsaP [Actinokineospora iranica]|uniref:Biotin synthase auxiliary protein n=1 Tax=Actinokineospora iranica TaxID=1271860 RepID=A0A1G6KDF4_9PSEU|nr:hypothetical protein [Actinokineospora iranica]SDC28957.1 hypothetical protein SAMN05216174_101848 [Actinokineospora iranica]
MFCVHCGQPAAAGDHLSCRGGRAALEPPRFCAECARRMVVQVTPVGWSARCSRHGESTSAGVPVLTD